MTESPDFNRMRVSYRRRSAFRETRKPSLFQNGFAVPSGSRSFVARIIIIDYAGVFDRTNQGALRVIMETDALRAFRGIDDIDTFASADRLVRTLSLASRAVHTCGCDE